MKLLRLCMSLLIELALFAGLTGYMPVVANAEMRQQRQRPSIARP